MLAAVIAPAAAAKEKHLDRVRVLLISKAARCTSCHADPGGKQLNAYGRRLADLPTDDPLADRIATLEGEPGFEDNEPQGKRATPDRDVDADGVANWIEILAETDPSNGRDKPDAELAQRIEKTIDCRLCHTATGLPGEGLAANPHNALGKLLAKTYAKRRGRRPPRGKEAVRAAAERTPILQRLSLARKKRPKKSKATYWQKIRLLHAPADPEDKPSAAALKAFKKQAARQKRRKSRDPNRGLACEAHGADGFLLDAPGLN